MHICVRTLRQITSIKYYADHIVPGDDRRCLAWSGRLWLLSPIDQFKFLDFFLAWEDQPTIAVLA